MSNTTPTIERAGYSRAMRAVRDEAAFRARIDAQAPEAASFYDRPRFTSASGRTVGFLDEAGVQQIAAEHEFMRDRIAILEAEIARMRSTAHRPRRRIA